MSSIREKLGSRTPGKAQYVRQVSYDAEGDDVRDRENTGANFTQVDFGVFLSLLKNLTKSELNIAVFLLSDFDYRTNCFDYSAKQIAEKVDVDIKTVEKAMAKLRGLDFMRRVQRSQWMINPTIAIRCSRKFFTRLMDDYYNLTYRPPKEKDGDNNAAR